MEWALTENSVTMAAEVPLARGNAEGLDFGLHPIEQNRDVRRAVRRSMRDFQGRET